MILNGECSESCPVLSGVPQGSVLGPLLFLCYINDLPAKSSIKLYADDALVYRRIHSETDQNNLQEDLHRLAQWAATWQMSFNVQKCMYLRITNKLHPYVYDYYMNDLHIQQVEHAKYLGIIIDKNLTWSEHVKKVVNKANSVRGFLQRNLTKCPLPIKSSCYLSLVRPILEYTCAIWSPYYQCNIHQVETVQRRAARYVMNNFNSYASVSEMIATLGWPTLEQRRKTLRTIMMYKIVNNLVEIPTDGILIPSELRLRGHAKKFLQPQCRVNAYLYSFFPQGIKLWNHLPQELTELENLTL